MGYSEYEYHKKLLMTLNGIMGELRLIRKEMQRPPSYVVQPHIEADTANGGEPTPEEVECEGIVHPRPKIAFKCQECHEDFETDLYVEQCTCGGYRYRLAVCPFCGGLSYFADL